MSARDDFPMLADFASRPSGRDPDLIARRRETGRALDELDRLRAVVEAAQAHYQFQRGPQDIDLNRMITDDLRMRVALDQVRP